ncbi:Di-copper centre-containing protein [Xylariaceae sp. FL0662B]|nr:Di-copper centre-containing protein [Xylariaceae sp. FL0662B]
MLMSVLAGNFVLLAVGKRTSNDPIPVVGLTTGIKNTGERPVRWNINALQDEGGPQWDLYIQGLAALQSKPESDEQSHFGVASIHGRPYTSYNGVGSVPGGSDGGFCPHGQILGTEVQRIASAYTGQNASAYLDAGKRFRVPYWDWAANPALPPSIVQENITVNGPQGPLTLRNPLYSYRWQTYPLNQEQFPGSGDWPSETTRGSDGHSDFSPDVVNSNLMAVADQLKDQIYLTFTTAQGYDQMSTMANSGVSFEASHNVIHNCVGGSFVSLEVTGFDPLFMLHHANLDRLVALWMAIHFNDTHQSETYTSGGLYATAKGENITAESPLKPFYQADGRTFHTGISVASLSAFGYTYPELTAWDLDRERGRQTVIDRVNALYGGRLTTMGKAPAQNESTEWHVELQVERSELQFPCTIDIYLGSKLAGRTALLGMPRQGLVHDTIPLQRAVGELNGNATSSATIEVFLQKQLRVEIKGVDGIMVDLANVQSLKLDVVAVAMTPPTSGSEFPQYGNRSTYTKVFGKYGSTYGTSPPGH